MTIKSHPSRENTYPICFYNCLHIPFRDCHCLISFLSLISVSFGFGFGRTKGKDREPFFLFIFYNVGIAVTNHTLGTLLARLLSIGDLVGWERCDGFSQCTFSTTVLFSYYSKLGGEDATPIYHRLRWKFACYI